MGAVKTFAQPWVAIFGALMLLATAIILVSSAFFGGRWIIRKFKQAEEGWDRFAIAFMVPLGVLAWLLLGWMLATAAARFLR